MAEVQGIPPTDPEGLGDDSLNALKGETSLIDAIKANTTEMQSLLTVLKPVSTPTSAIGSSSQDSSALLANTTAILALTDSINTATVDINVKGLSSSFFAQLLSFVGSKKNSAGLETFSKIFESSVKRMAGLESYAKSIDTVAASLLGAFGTFKEFGKGLLLFSAGLALLGITLITFMEAITIDEILTFAMVMLTLRLATEMITGEAWDIAKVSIGIAILGLAIWGFTELITFEKALQFDATIVLIAAGIWVMNKLTSGLGDNATGLAKGALAIAAIAGAIWILNKAVSDFSPIDLKTTGEMILITAALGFEFKLLGKASESIILGSLAAVAMGAGIWVLAKGISAISEIDISLEQGLTFAAIAIAAGGIFAFIGTPPIAEFIAMGAIAAAATGAAIWVLAKGINAISTVTTTEKQAETFGLAIGYVIDALSVLGNPFNAAAMLIAVPAGLAVAASAWALTKAINSIASMQLLTPAQYDNFSYGITRIVEAYTAIGGWDIAKAGIASGVIMLVAGASVMTALAINAFTKISADPSAVDNAVLSLDSFIAGISTSFDKNKTKFANIQLGIHSFFGLSSMVKEIAESVQAISNMEFLTKEVRNGKVVTTGVRKFTPADFAGVGISIGQILHALTDPLAQISSKQDSFSIGGFTITNPFSNKVQEGIAAMQGIGKVFMPIANILTIFAENHVDKAFIQGFNQNLALVLNGISTAFSSDTLKLDDHVIDRMADASHIVRGIMNLSMRPAFSKGVTGFHAFSTDLGSIKNSMNAFDLAKLTKFTTMLSYLNELQKSDSMKELVDAFKEFIETFIDYTESHAQGQTSNTTNSEPIAATTTKASILPKALSNAFSSNNKPTPEIHTMDDAAKVIQQLYDYLASGQLKVNIKPAY